MSSKQLHNLFVYKKYNENKVAKRAFVVLDAVF